MPNTPRGIWYPDGAVKASALDTLQQLAESVDDAVDQLEADVVAKIPYSRIETGSVTVPVGGTPSTGQVSVTFSKPFTGSLPALFVSTGNWLYTVSWGSRTLTGFLVSARRSTEASSSVTSIPVSWLAIG